MAKSIKAFLERERRLSVIVEMAKTKSINSADVISSDPKNFNRSNTSLFFMWLIENKYLKSNRRVNHKNNKSMWYYDWTGKEYNKLSLEDYYKLGIGYKRHPKPSPVPIPATFKPHPQGRIIKLLDKPLPRPKNDGYGRKVGIGIASSFYMMD